MYANASNDTHFKTHISLYLVWRTHFMGKKVTISQQKLWLLDLEHMDGFQIEIESQHIPNMQFFIPFVDNEYWKDYSNNV